MFIKWELGNSFSQCTLVHPKNWVSPFILCTLPYFAAWEFTHSLHSSPSCNLGSSFTQTISFFFSNRGSSFILLCFSQLWSSLTQEFTYSLHSSLLAFAGVHLNKPYCFITTWEVYSLSHYTLLLQYSQTRSSFALCTFSFFKSRRSLNYYNSSQLGSSLIMCAPTFFEAGRTHLLTLLFLNTQM